MVASIKLPLNVDVKAEFREDNATALKQNIAPRYTTHLSVPHRSWSDDQQFDLNVSDSPPTFGIGHHRSPISLTIGNPKARSERLSCTDLVLV